MLIHQDIAVIKEVSFSTLNDCVYVETPIAYWKIYTSPLRPRLVVDHKHKGKQKERHNQGGETVFNPDYDGFWRAMDYIIQHDWDYKRVNTAEPMLISVKNRSKYARPNLNVKKSNDEKIEDTLKIFNSKKSSPNIDVSVYEDPEHKGYFCTEIKINDLVRAKKENFFMYKPSTKNEKINQEFP